MNRWWHRLRAAARTVAELMRPDGLSPQPRLTGYPVQRR